MHRLLAALLLLLHPAASFQPLSSQLSEKKGKPQRVLLARALLPLVPSAPSLVAAGEPGRCGAGD